jgi:hypothetical protein
MSRAGLVLTSRASYTGNQEVFIHEDINYGKCDVRCSRAGQLLRCQRRVTRVVTSVLRSLGEIDAQLAKLTGNPDTGAFAVEQAALMSRADVEVKRLPLSQLVEVHYNYVIPHGVNGHLRLEIPGTCWDAAAPLYLS